MTQSSCPAPLPRRSVSGVDLAVSITALVLTVAMIATAAVLGFFSLAFLDHCPPESCSEEGAVDAVFNAVLIAAAIGAAGLVVTIVQLARRRRGWPFAASTFGLCLVTFVLGGVALNMAVT
ncbi:hypothetical protein H7J88_04930 [Mycolicibacterium flavescens]|uniref:Transmembrane protein n=1 Tax=Mycolicibacterium flavescens TaxID=1776 RepID=A0A1E3RMC1_MYCFV|nr:hypothetical protein [Mycolicibacterium flavescens]MCV7278987.1 hypothetical protein [Mycolicibacterium flavescens]ODQ90582.1 hypothetical protein BHQ18_10625 [Mycolicibacterium flavescens]